MKTELKIGFRCFIICIYNLLLGFFQHCVYYVSTYVTTSISTGLYPNLDLLNANKLHYSMNINYHKKPWLSLAQLHPCSHIRSMKHACWAQTTKLYVYLRVTNRTAHQSQLCNLHRNVGFYVAR